VENIDIFPTIMDILGLSKKAQDELWPPIEGVRGRECVTECLYAYVGGERVLPLSA
jgi:hypothetical protein